MEVADLHTTGTTGLLHDRSRSDQPNLPVCENLRRTASKKGIERVLLCPTLSNIVQGIPLELWSNPKPCDVSIDSPSLVFRRLCVRELVQAFDNALIGSLHSKAMLDRQQGPQCLLQSLK